MDEYLKTLSTDELIQMALAEEDEDKFWQIKVVLEYRGNEEVFKALVKLCNSSDIKEKSIGVNILGQLGLPERTFPEETLKIFHRIIKEETDSELLNEALVAIGHTQDKEDSTNIDDVIKFKNHQDATVRFGVVFALSGREDVKAISALLELMRDPDEKVRDWATMEIASFIEADTPEIREALWERLSDWPLDIYGEALIGLAKRKDERAYDVILKQIESGDPGGLIFDAAYELGDVRLIEPLRNLLNISSQEEDINESWLDDIRFAIEMLEKEPEE